MSVLEITVRDLGRTITLPGAVARLEYLSNNLSDESVGSVTDYALPTRGDALEVNVDPGQYRVQLIFPSGRIISKTATVNEQEGGTVEFALRSVSDYSNYGVAKLTKFARIQRSRSSDAAGNSLLGDVEPSSNYLSPSQRQFYRRAIEVIPKSPPEPQVITNGVTAMMTHKHPSSTSLRVITQTHKEGAVMWRLIKNGDIAGWAKLPIHVRRAKREYAERIWQVGDIEVKDFRRVHARRWAFTEVKDELRLASVPAPWIDLSGGRQVQVHRAIDNGSSRLSVSVIDSQLSGLLEILRYGRLGVARAVLIAAEDGQFIETTISDKRSNPLGACAAAYVGLAIVDPTEREQWDPWLFNLKNWFKWLPDGAILYARRIMLRPRYPGEKNEILPALKQAYAAGIPFYGVGLQLLRDMLTIYAGKDEEACLMRDNVVRVAARLDLSETFTVLRFRRENV